jgi:hypothetical protein
VKKSHSQTKVAIMAEMRQLHDMHVFQHVNKSDLSNQDLSRVLSLLMIIKQKRCVQFKARAFTDERPQCLIHEKMDSSSPIVQTESVVVTSLIDADDSRFVEAYDIPGGLLYLKLDEVVHMKVTGALSE